MNLTHNLAQLQQDHVTFQLECIDRMYLNAYVPKLTSEGGIAAFCRGYLGHRFASTKQAIDMTKTFVKSIEDFIQREDLELVRFQKGQRKDDVFQKKLRRFNRRVLEVERLTHDSHIGRLGCAYRNTSTQSSRDGG